MKNSIQKIFLNQLNLFSGTLLIISVLISTYLTLAFDSVAVKDVVVLAILLITIILFLIAPFSKSTWVPIIISLLLFRDLSLGSIVGEGTLKIGDMFIAWLFILWVLSDIFLKNATKIVKSNLDTLLLVFIGLNMLSLFWSTDLTYGLVRCLKLVRNLMFYLLIRELFISHFWRSYKRLTVSYLLTSMLLLIVYLAVVLMSGGFEDFLSLYQKKTLTSLDLGALRVRGTGAGLLISGPSMWFMISGALAFGALILTRSGMKKKMLVVAVLVLFSSATVLTLARSIFGMLAILCMLLFIGSIYIKSKKYLLSISAILTVFVLAGGSIGIGGIYTKRFTNAFKDGSWIQREEMYNAAIGAFQEAPILGIGAGSNYSWQLNYPEIGANRSRIVHSAYLLVLSELGLVGIIIFGAVIYTWLWYLWSSIQNRELDSSVQGLCMVLLAFSLSYLAYISIVGEFEAFEPWLVMAIASAVKNLDTNEADKIDKNVLILKSE